MKRLSNKQFQKEFSEQLKRDNEIFRRFYIQDRIITESIKQLKKDIARMKKSGTSGIVI